MEITFEPAHDKPYKIACAPSEDSDQPGHPPSLISVFAVRSMGSSGPKLSSCGQQRLCSDWVDAQADLSLRWAHKPFCRFYHAPAHLQLPVWVSIPSEKASTLKEKTNVPKGSQFFSFRVDSFT